MIRIITQSALRMCAEHVRRMVLQSGKDVWLYEGRDGADLHASSTECPGMALIGRYGEAATLEWIEHDIEAHICAGRTTNEQVG